MKLFIYLISILSVLLLGCDSDNNPTTSEFLQNGVIVPLKVGNYWSYIDSSFTENGILEKVDSSTLSITGYSDVSYKGSNLQVFHWTWIFEGQSSNFSWLFRNETDGLYSYGTRSLDSNYIYDKSLLFKYPVKVNDSWQNIEHYSSPGDTIYYSDTIAYTCISINEKFITPGGVFSCIVYNSKRNNNYDFYDSYIYFAKNIGYLGLLTKKNGIVTFKKVLSSYNLTKIIFEPSQISLKSIKNNGTFLKPNFK